MILPKILINSKINLRAKFSGIDSYPHCLDKKHFKSFPNEVDYLYNSRGFRDREWPNSLDELKESIWCIGDSFTVGIGSPIDHTWVRQLELKTKKRCINIGSDGASNFWIARQATDILTTINPKIIIIHWSYSQRIEEFVNNSYVQKHYDLTKLDNNLLVENFISCYNNVEENKSLTTVIHSFIPFWHPLKFLDKEWDKLRGPLWPASAPKNLVDYLSLPNWILEELNSCNFTTEKVESYFLLKCILNDHRSIENFEPLDYARDGHHYDIKTADYFSNLLIDKLRSISSEKAI